ncbi:MAG: hypothetical protein ACKPKO_26355 [Candidatus Fonsibacter sp.]
MSVHQYLQQEALQHLLETITGRSLAITGTSGSLQTPTSQGCYIGQASSGYTAIELVSGVGTSYQSYIDFTEPNVYVK